MLEEDYNITLLVECDMPVGAGIVCIVNLCTLYWALHATCIKNLIIQAMAE